MSQSKPSELTFEQAMARLDEIVSAMEGDRMPLEDMVVVYEEGSQLLKVCRQRIETARSRVELIANRAQAANAELVPFQAQEEPAEMAKTIPQATAPARQAAPRRKPAPLPDDDDIRLF